MNLSTVLRIIVSCLLNAVVAWTVDYYATSLLSRRDVFRSEEHTSELQSH